MSRNPSLVVEAKISGTDIKTEVDTGDPRSIVNMETYALRCLINRGVRVLISPFFPTPQRLLGPPVH